MNKIIIYLTLASCICLSRSQVWDPHKYKFSKSFLFGVSTSAYQIEGAYNEEGKGESIWDRYFHMRDKDGDTPGDTACDSYRECERDVRMLTELGVDFYRFSVSWSRVLPTGFPNKINKNGLKYYQNLIEELRKHNIEPMVTMYHFDLPQPLQDLGGWANPNIQYWFEDYARVLYDNLPGVKYWITINQPSICFESYSGGNLAAPNVDSRGVGDYMCVKNMLLAHARAYRLFVNTYKEANKKSTAQVGISVGLNWADPINHNKSNNELNDATQRFREFTIDLYLHPIFSKKGGFPKAVKDIVARNSKEEGYPRSRLPDLTEEEIILIKNSADFLGMNHYTSHYISLPAPGSNSEDYKSFPIDIGNVRITQGESWAASKSPWLKSAPYGIYHINMYLAKQYGTLPIFITEHGWSTGPGLEDVDRINSIREYLKALAYAIKDGVDVKGLAIWSLMDNVEWTAEISERFGLYEVDFASQHKTRTPRLSAHFYRHLVHTRLIEDDWKPSADNLNTLPVSKRRIKALKKDRAHSEL